MTDYAFNASQEAARAATAANQASQEAMEQAALHARQQRAARAAAEKIGNGILVVGGLLLATAAGVFFFNKRK